MEENIFWRGKGRGFSDRYIDTLHQQYDRLTWPNAEKVEDDDPGLEVEVYVQGVEVHHNELLRVMDAINIRNLTKYERMSYFKFDIDNIFHNFFEKGHNNSLAKRRTSVLS